MKSKAPLSVLFCCLLGFAVMPAAAQRTASLAVGGGEATVTLLDGPSEVLKAGKEVRQPLKLRDAIGEGDEVRTGPKARIELLLPDKSLVRFAERSSFRLIRMEAGSPTRSRDVKLHLLLGKAWSNVAQAAGREGEFQMISDRAAAGVRGTVYRMNVEEDRSALVRVYDGTVHVTGGGAELQKALPPGPPSRVSGPKPVPGPRKVTREEWTVIIKAMQQVRIGADGTPDKPEVFTEAEDRDAWVEWNQARDRRP
jgi:hypothetical protein